MASAGGRDRAIRVEGPRRMPYMRYARLILPTVLALLVIALVVLLSGCGGGGGY